MPFKSGESAITSTRKNRSHITRLSLLPPLPYDVMIGAQILTALLTSQGNCITIFTLPCSSPEVWKKFKKSQKTKKFHFINCVIILIFLIIIFTLHLVSHYIFQGTFYFFITNIMIILLWHSYWMHRISCQRECLNVYSWILRVRRASATR